MKKLSSVFVGLLIVSFTLLSGCNTAKGFGQDVKDTGQTIENAANKAKN